MRVMRPALLLLEPGMAALLLVSLVLQSSALPVHHAAGRAQRDEVDVLIYGVLQFSQALKENYRSTIAKIQKAFHRLEVCNQTLGALRGEAMNIRQTGQRLKGTIGALQTEERMMRLKSLAIHRTLQDMQEEQKNQQEQLRKVENWLSLLRWWLARRDAHSPSALKTQAEHHHPVPEGSATVAAEEIPGTGTATDRQQPEKAAPLKQHRLK
uniref:Uncharacterized protein LOC117349885 n=1 Tax=Geotrypetes seraphini TaxID=260995 RepID=A0A6P8P712_GEOSA|nr:uncharacterized protein LOC117349885 [Geotrypetes seraphini]